MHRVLKFKEKPDFETAKTMLASGDHDWNSGMFIWKVDNILREFKHQMPELMPSPASKEIGHRAGNRDNPDVWLRIEDQSPSTTGSWKKPARGGHPATDLGWDDIGSWESLFEVLHRTRTETSSIGCEPLGD